MLVRTVAAASMRPFGHTSPAPPARSVCWRSLRDALQSNDRQVLAFGTIAEVEFHHGARPSSNQRMWPRARRPSRPAVARLEPGTPTRREPTVIDLVWGSARESGMRSVPVVPVDVQQQLMLEGCEAEGDEDRPRTLVLHRADESLEDPEAAVLADGTEPLLDATMPTPRAELVGGELRALIGDEVPGPAACLSGSAVEELHGCKGRRLALEDHDAHHAAGEMIDDHGNPPAEGPALSTETDSWTLSASLKTISMPRWAIRSPRWRERPWMAPPSVGRTRLGSFRTTEQEFARSGRLRQRGGDPASRDV